MPAKVSPEDREARARRVQQRLEWPVIAAAVLTMPIIAIQESDLGGAWPAIMNWVLWLTFLTEVVVMLAIVPNRTRWLRGHVIDLAVVALTPPFAPAAWQATRLFRLIRLLRLLRLLSLRKVLSLDGVKYAAFVALGTVIIGSAAPADARGCRRVACR